MSDSKTLTLGRRALFSLLVAVALLVNTVGAALAWVGTDQMDYSPGSVVTISGDNRDGAGYLPDETVGVHVVGPNGYTADCNAIADDNGAWSCQVTLWDSYLAVGEYTYTATGANVTESGTFTDAINVASFLAGCSTGSTSFTSGATVCAKATGLPGGGGGSSGKIEWWAPGVGSATRTTVFSGVSGNFTDSWVPAVSSGSVCGEWTLKVYSPATTLQDNFTFEVTGCVTNTPPTVDAGGPYSGDEGSAIAISGTASDPDGDSLTYLWTYSVVTADAGATCSFADATALSTTVTCTDDGAFTVTLTATGDPAGPVNDAADLTVANVAPMVTLSGPDAADEGETKSYSFTTSDPGANDTFTGSASCGASGAVQNFTIDNASGDGSFDCVFVDDNPTGTPSDTSTVAVTVTDDDGSSDSASIDVTVSNVAPVITAFACPADPVAVNTPVTLAGAFTDVGTTDTHTASIAWGDSSSSAATVAQGSGSGAVSGSHTYSSAGIYTPQLTVADDDTGSASADCQYVVVYDPSAGFVTGGGWITSPAGAYVADPDLTGRANFGFVSRYKRGQSVPDGQTQFQFQAGNLNFHSTAYQWLVVSGAKATYKGWGAINGSGNYGFLLSAIDGQRTGGGGIDKFRIKIWDVACSAVVYDNNLGGGDDADPTTALGGGSIVIHSR